MSEDTPYFSLKELYRLRRASLTEMVNDCYERLLGDPTITILTDSYIIGQHKLQSIQRIVGTLIDSESELMVAKLTTEEEFLKSEIRILKERLNHYMMEAEVNTPRQSIDTMKKKLNGIERQKKEQEAEFRSLLEQHGFEFVNSIEYSLQRVLKEYEFASRGVTTREQLIKRLYMEIGDLKRFEDEQPEISQKRSAYRENSEKDGFVSRPSNMQIEQLNTEIDRLNGVIKGFTQTRNSTHQLLQKKIEDSEHKNQRDIRLLRENESKLRQQIQSKLSQLEQQNTLLGKQLTHLEKQNSELKDDNAVMRIQLDQANHNKQQFEVRLRELEENFDSMRAETEVLEFENRNTRSQVDKHKQQEEQLQRQLKLFHQQAKQSKLVIEQQNIEIESNIQLHKQELNKIREEYRISLEAATKQNSELRQKVMTNMAQLELTKNQAVSKSKRINENAELHRQSEYIKEMERVCNERVDQFERELQEKNQNIVVLTKEKIQHMRKLENLESRLGQYERVCDEKQHSFSYMNNDVDMVNKALIFERKMHEQQSQHLRKITSTEITKLNKQIVQLKELLIQKESIIKYCHIRGNNKSPFKSTKTLLLLKEQISRIASQHRCLQHMVKSQLKASAELFQVLLTQFPLQSEDDKLREANRNRKTKKKTVIQPYLQRRSIDNRDHQLETLNRRIAEDQRYMHHLNRLLMSEDSD